MAVEQVERGAALPAPGGQGDVPVPAPVADGELADLIRELGALRASLLEAEALWRPRLEAVPEWRRASARNLVHYLALRQRDLRPLQERLAARGLSSLGRAECHVLASVDAVLEILHRAAGLPWRPPDEAGVGYAAGEALLRRQTEALLGPQPEARAVRVVVTAPASAATDYDLVRDLLATGMDCLRIDCARGDSPPWAATIAHLRRAEAEVGRPCRVLLDLAGPAPRTGPLRPGPAVVKWRPRRDATGVLVAPARVWLTGTAAPAPAPGPADAVLPVPDAWLATLTAHDRLRFVDARGARRALEIAAVAAGGCWATGQRTAYVESGTRLEVRGRRGTGERARVGPLPPLERPIVLRPGDTLLVTRDQDAGHPEVLDGAGRVAAPARIACTLPEALDDVRRGERIWFDGGKIGGRVRGVDAAAGVLAVEITHARAGGSRLRAGRRISLPESALRVPTLTDKDVQDLAFAAARADLVGLPFVRTPETVRELLARLEALGGPARRLGVVLNVGTRSGFAQLPDVLLAAMAAPAFGVMIAGGLAAEVGSGRLTEMQEEILGLCAAAHTPVIWGTAVLADLARTGRPTRGEVTSAAAAAGADGVLLAGGPQVTAAAEVLGDVLRRLHGHRHKKTALLRRLRTWSIDDGATPRASEYDPETEQR
jgi:pyruvate kinase